MDRLPALYRQFELILESSVCGRSSNLVVADIGADHGLLSKQLLKTGLVSKMIVTDIAEKPLARAKENIGETPNVEYRLGDGLSNGDFSDVDIFFIAGMGGDEVVQILNNAGKIKSGSVFVLQPMTRFDRIMNVIDSSYRWTYCVNDSGKSYRILVTTSDFLLDRNSDCGIPSQFEKSCKEKANRVSALQNLFLEMPMVLDYSENYCDKKERTERILKENINEAKMFFETLLRAHEVIEANAGKTDSSAHKAAVRKRRAQIEEVIELLKKV